MRRTAAVAVLALAGATLTVPAQAAEPPTPGGCKAFGENVAFLGQNLGRTFGETASGVAKSGPGEFRDNVVKHEQQALCP